MAFSTGLSLVALFLMFRPLEIVFAAKKQKLFRPGWFTDLCFFLGQYLLWSGLVLWLLLKFGGWIDEVVPAKFRAAVAAQALWVQAIEVVLLSDLFIYWGHRLQHRVGFLWRFHSIHHSAEHLDWLAAHREHPIDTIYTMGLINLPAFVMGFPLQTIAILMAFRGLWAIYIHSNVRLPIGPLRVLIGAPELHHWHHDRARDAGNYANISPIMDVIFGTYRCPDHEPESFGISEPISKNYLGQMMHPFLSRKLRQKSGVPATRPSVGEVLEAKALEDGTTGGEGVDLEVFCAGGGMARFRRSWSRRCKIF
ncbi:MAG TPA: sterol desaturase family protein [Tepidisphaeraceae bacterium]|jgi:sterol desaturase/sphingolipid hydroxylase (fatty acid hydroxylase superfamily)|nr:sterol desaturase family protein [Tepidisphaeraceae bacterium]